MAEQDSFRNKIPPIRCAEDQFRRAVSKSIEEIYINVTNITELLESLNTVRNIDASIEVTQVSIFEFGHSEIIDRGGNVARIIPGPFTHVVRTTGSIAAWVIGDPTQATVEVHELDPDNGGLADTGDTITVNYMGSTALSANRYYLAHRDHAGDWWIVSPGCCDGNNGGGVTGTDPPTGGGGPSGNGDSFGCSDWCSGTTSRYQYDLLFNCDDVPDAGPCGCACDETFDGETFRVTRQTACRYLYWHPGVNITCDNYMIRLQFMVPGDRLDGYSVYATPANTWELIVTLEIRKQGGWTRHFFKKSFTSATALNKDCDLSAEKLYAWKRHYQHSSGWVDHPCTDSYVQVDAVNL